MFEIRDIAGTILLLVAFSCLVMLCLSLISPSAGLFFATPSKRNRGRAAGIWLLGFLFFCCLAEIVLPYSEDFLDNPVTPAPVDAALIFFTAAFGVPFIILIKNSLKPAPGEIPGTNPAGRVMQPAPVQTVQGQGFQPHAQPQPQPQPHSQTYGQAYGQASGQAPAQPSAHPQATTAQAAYNPNSTAQQAPQATSGQQAPAAGSNVGLPASSQAMPVAGFEVFAEAGSCTCEDWTNFRKHLPPENPGRMCRHLVAHYNKNKESVPAHWRSLLSCIANHASRNEGFALSAYATWGLTPDGEGWYMTTESPLAPG